MDHLEESKRLLESVLEEGLAYDSGQFKQETLALAVGHVLIALVERLDALSVRVESVRTQIEN